MISRREFIESAVVVAAFRDDTLDLVAKAVEWADKHPETAAQDEDFWAKIQAAFTQDRNLINFNNGGVCPAPRIVQEAMKRQLDYANQAPAYHMWRHLEPEVERVRTRLAKHFGCDREEMAITRNASEALEILLYGIDLEPEVEHVRTRLAKHFGCDREEIAITRNASEALEIALYGIDLEPGDEILTTNQDYGRMRTTIDQRVRREGVKKVLVKFPTVPKDMSELTAAIEGGITSRTKMILICHVINLTGQIWPVKEVVELGRRRGIPVIVDGAHAFAHFPFSNEDMKCEYYGTSLHKWLMAPIGTGFLYVKKDKINDLWSLMASNEEQSADIRKYEEIGTHPAANHNAIAEALTFHEMIGVERKAARLRYLRTKWISKIREEKSVSYNTNLTDEHSCGITNVKIDGIDPGDLTTWLMDSYGIMVVAINHAQYQGIRVTPNVYSTLSEIELFGDAMLKACREGIG